MEYTFINNYIDELLRESTFDAPAWNIEKKRAGAKSGWNYIDGLMLKALLEINKVTKNEKYFYFVEKYIDYRIHDDGSIDGYDVNERNIDNINEGKILFELYEKTKKDKYRKALDLIYSQISLMPRTAEGNFWHKQIYTEQVWLDGLYMCMPFYMEYETKYNNGKNYPDIFGQFNNVINCMKDKETGLYRHAYDHRRQAFWCDSETGLSKCCWLRAIGWFVMALLDTIEQMDEKCLSENPECNGDLLKESFAELCDSMRKYQHSSGMWYQVVDKGGYGDNYLETSGSAIMSYGFLKGARMGILPEIYAEYGTKAFQGICNKYISEEDGRMHLGGICLVAGLGGKNMRDGTFEYYMSEPVVMDDAKGVGPFLLAYSELLRKV